MHKISYKRITLNPFLQWIEMELKALTYHCADDADKDEDTSPEIGNEYQGHNKYTNSSNSKVSVQFHFQHLKEFSENSSLIYFALKIDTLKLI